MLSQTWAPLLKIFALENLEKGMGDEDVTIGIINYKTDPFLLHAPKKEPVMTEKDPHFSTPKVEARVNEINALLVRTDDQIERMEAASRLSNNLKELSPVLSPILADVSSLIQNIYASYNNINQMRITVADKRHMRETLTPAITRRIDQLHDQTSALIRQLEKTGGAERDQIVQLLMKFNSDANEFASNLLTKLM
jgi:uncharacterized phage infection (PIP) family protein YhgE